MEVKTPTALIRVFASSKLFSECQRRPAIQFADLRSSLPSDLGQHRYRRRALQHHHSKKHRQLSCGSGDSYTRCFLLRSICKKQGSPLPVIVAKPQEARRNDSLGIRRGIRLQICNSKKSARRTLPDGLPGDGASPPDLFREGSPPNPIGKSFSFSIAVVIISATSRRTGSKGKR